MAVFREEYTRHTTRSPASNAVREGARAELARGDRAVDRLVQAFLDGATPVRTVKDRMAQLEARKEVLEAQLAQGEGVKVSVHPSMPASTRACGQSAGCARERGCQAEAAEIMRALIDKIVLTPVCRDARRPCRSPYTATSPASSASPQKQKGRSTRAALWWSAQNWLRGQDSNLRPSGYEPDELPDCSTPRETRSEA